jgi:UDP-4-amino-4,6-dideoxy-N-acetyl-beta-L-altrosamine transaminase
MEFIHYGHQSISDADIEAVTEVLRSDFLTTGPAVAKFEQAVMSYTGAQFGVAMSNATAALHVACMALDVGPGDWVWTSPNTFLASANCALYCGAQIDFVDIDPDTWNMSVTQLQEKLEQAKRQGKLPKVVIPVHFSGEPCDMRAIKKLADQYGFKVIEDASHAIGGSYLNKPIGACEFSHITIFSFHPVKIITTGEGGMAMTNDAKLDHKMRLLRCHGMTRDEADMDGKKEGGWYYEQIALGYNYRITDFQCALGVSQMQRLDPFVSKRHQIAKQYNHDLADLPIQLPHFAKEAYSGLHLYVILVDAAERKRIFDGLRAANIGVNVHYPPVHLQPYYRKQFGFKTGDFPAAEAYYQRAISLPMFPDLTPVQQSYIVERLTSLVK